MGRPAQDALPRTRMASDHPRHPPALPKPHPSASVGCLKARRPRGCQRGTPHHPRTHDRRARGVACWQPGCSGCCRGHSAHPLYVAAHVAGTHPRSIKCARWHVSLLTPNAAGALVPPTLLISSPCAPPTNALSHHFDLMVSGSPLVSPGTLLTPSLFSPSAMQGTSLPTNEGEEPDMFAALHASCMSLQF